MSNSTKNAAITLSEDSDKDRVFAEQVLRAEARAIEQIEIRPEFHKAVQLIVDSTGPGHRGTLMVSGLGKSGLIGQKISATFASTGTPSYTLHPVEAMHGDLGRVRHSDIAMLLSFTGSTPEIVALASVLAQDEIPIIAMVGKSTSDLEQLARLTLTIGDVSEACPHDLAPTASTTAMLALGDALALSVSRRRGFRVDDFYKVHPGGELGRQLMPVVSAMRFLAGKNLPLIRKGLSVSKALGEAKRSAGRRAGAFLIVDDAGALAGMFTDADLRRLVANSADVDSALSQPIEQVMTSNPFVLPNSAMVRDAIQMAREFRFDEIPVVDSDGRPLGLIDVQDLIAPKVVEG